MTTLSTRWALAKSPRSELTTRMLAAGSNERLKVRVLETLVRCSRITSPARAVAFHVVSPFTSITLPNRPIAACVGVSAP